MNAGLPGTGIGGVFYLLLVVWMPVREMWLTLMGRSSLLRWKFVAKHLCLAGAIVLGLLGEAWLFKRGFELLVHNTREGSVVHEAGMFGSNAMIPALAALPFIILIILFVGVHLLRLKFANRKDKSPINF